MDDKNPFSSGVTGEGPELGANEVGTLEPVDLDVVQILERSWNLVTSNVGIVVAAFAFQFVPTFLVSGIATGLQMAGEASNDDVMKLMFQMAYLAVNLANTLLGVFISLGLARVFTRLARGLPAEPAMLFGEGRRYIHALLGTIVLGFATLLGLLLFIVPGIVIGIGLQFFLYALVDQDLPAMDALKESWRLTDGNKVTIFLTNLAIAVFSIVLTCVTCGFGYLLLLPVLSLSQAVMYHSLVHLRGTARAPLGT